MLAQLMIKLKRDEPSWPRVEQAYKLWVFCPALPVGMVADKIPVDTQGYMPISIPTREKKDITYTWTNHTRTKPFVQTVQINSCWRWEDVFEKILKEVEGSFWKLMHSGRVIFKNPHDFLHGLYEVLGLHMIRSLLVPITCQGYKITPYTYLPWPSDTYTH
jgi:hypothetical protein